MTMEERKIRIAKLEFFTPAAQIHMRRSEMYRMFIPMRFCMKKILILLFLTCAFGYAHAQQIIKVPKGDGTPVLTDGKFSSEEWRDAITVAAAPSVKLYLKQFRNNVFIGVNMETESPSYVDIFLQTGDNQLYNLHASAQIGERLLTGDAWTDTNPPPRWGNHVDWIANEAKVDSDKTRDLPFPKKLFPYAGMEFQLRRSRFTGKSWRIRIEVRDFVGQSPDIVFPNGSERKNTTRWAILNL